MTTVFRAEPTGSAPALLGEGPIWDAQQERLLWIDILGRTVNVADGQGDTVHTQTLSRTPGTVMPAPDGAFLLATDHGLELHESDGRVVELDRSLAADDDLRFNDGKVDPFGRAVVGTLSLSGRRDACALYRFGEAEGPEEILAPVSLSNGLGWSPDGGTFYFADTPTGRIDAFDYDGATGTLSARRAFAHVPVGLPDGLCVDDDGGVWVALWGGSAVVRYDPNGTEDARIELDVPNITSCAFGGARGDTLFITTASVDLSEEFLAEHPDAGRLFRADVGRSGPPATPWRKKPPMSR